MRKRRPPVEYRLYMPAGDFVKIDGREEAESFAEELCSKPGSIPEVKGISADRSHMFVYATVPGGTEKVLDGTADEVESELFGTAKE
jgi:hypothetical protein